MRKNFFATLLVSLLIAALPQSVAAQGQRQDPEREAPPQTRPQPRPAAAPEEEKATSREFAAIRSGTKLTAELESTVDASKAKPGDEVTARVTKDVKQEGQVVIRKGDRLAGRITEVQTSAAGKAGSKVSLAFDRMLRGDAEHRLNAVVTSVVSTPAERRAPEQRTDREPLMDPSARPAPRGGGGSASGGLLGGATSTVGGTVSGVGSGASATIEGTTGAAASTAQTAGASVDAASRTAVGSAAGATLATPRRAIRLESQSSAEGQTGMNSVLSSREGNLRMESGTQLEFRVEGEAKGQARK